MQVRNISVTQSNDVDGGGQNDASKIMAGADAGGGMTPIWADAVGKTYRVRRPQELGTDKYEITGQGIPAVQPLTSFTNSEPWPRFEFSRQRGRTAPILRPPS